MINTFGFRAALCAALWVLSPGCVRGAGPRSTLAQATRTPAEVAAAHRLACESRNEQCGDWAMDLMAGRGVREDHDAARALVERRCAANDARCCAHLGALVRGEGDEAGAVALFRRACEANDAFGCNDLGDAYLRGAGVPRDEARGEALVARACALHDPVGCVNVGERAWRATPRNYEAAVQGFRAGCEGGDARGCERLSYALMRAPDGTWNGADAVAAMRRACSAADDTDCTRGASLERSVAALDAARAGCDNGRPAACGALGGFWMRGDVVEFDAARAESLLRRACDGGHGESCTTLGDLLTNDDREDRQARGAAMLSEACTHGDPRACVYLGVALVGGHGVGRDDVRARGLFRAACDAGQGEGCAHFAWTMLDARGGPADAPEATAILTRTCGRGERLACQYLARVYDGAWGGPVNPERAAMMLDHACELGAASACETARERARERLVLQVRMARCEAGDVGACVESAVVQYERDAPEAQAAAAEVFRRACEAGNDEGCFRRAVALEVGRGVVVDEAAAAGIFRRQCDARNPRACWRLGQMVSEGRGTVRDDTRANRLYERACVGEDFRGCGALGARTYWGVGVPQNRPRGLMLLRRACEHDQAYACGVLGRIGMDGAPDDARASVALLVRACDAGEGFACFDAARAARRGIGMARDEAHADALLARACENGSLDGCTQQVARAMVSEAARIDPAHGALSLAIEGCAHERASACWYEGTLRALGVGGPRDASAAASRWARARELFGADCERGDADACGWLAHLLRYGVGVPVDLARAQTLHASACAASPSQCGDLHVEAPATRRDHATRAAALDVACEGGSSRACVMLAGLLERGDGIARDGARARTLREANLASLAAECEVDVDGLANLALGRALRDGAGADRDERRAVTHLDRACALGLAPACVDAAALYGRRASPVFDAVRAARRREDACALGARAACGRNGRAAPNGPAGGPSVPWDGAAS